MINTKLQVALEKANQEIEGKKDEIKNAAYRLKYHFMAPVGWINDPNGFVQYKGEYHLFYQYYPYASSWGPMHWGHAKSTDAVNWEHLPVALAPSEPYDSGDAEGHGCFSGSAVQDGEELVLIYTGHVDGNKPMQVQNIAISTDGVNFEKYDGNPVIGEIPAEGSADFRDPKVWRHEDKWYMVVGSKKDGKGKAILYVSEDLRNWEYLGAATESDGTQGDMWECPDLFPIENRHALIISPMLGTQNENPLYIIGEMNYEQGNFTQQVSKTLDYGFDFYAPQTLVDDKGRRIMIAWMEKWLTKMPSQDHGWAGAMTITRELVLEGDVLKQKPLDEMAEMRFNHKKYHALKVDGKVTLGDIEEESVEIIIDFDVKNTTASVFGLQLRSSVDGKERTDLIVDLKNKEISMDRTLSGAGEKGVSKAPLHVKEDGALSLRIFMDTTSLEVFINDGEEVITNRIFPAEDSNQFNLFAKNGRVNVTRIESWNLKSIWD